MKLRLNLPAGAACLAVICLAAHAQAQDRPSEAEMFGAAPAPEPAADADAGAPEAPALQPTAAAPPAAASGADSRDQAVLGGVDRPMFTETMPPEDPLTIGGMLYLRLQGTAYDHTAPGDWSLTSPTLMDVFFDARPNDRVRAFALGRMTFDPLQPAVASAISEAQSMNMTGTAGSSSLAPNVTGQTSSPRVALDQFWLRFDIAHRVFVTAGRQHVRWGTGRIWARTDFLHMRRRNPLDVFDVRTGTTMLKLHLPIEEQAWNFYGYLVTEGQDGVPTFKTPAGALRAELVFGQLEIGLGVFGRAKSRAKFAADISAGIGDIDFYGEVAVVDARESDRVDFAGYPAVLAQPMGTPLPVLIDTAYPIYRNIGYRPQAVVGLSYSRKYNDNDTFTIGAEYFYNGLGYDEPESYFGLYLPHTRTLRNPASSFYLGQHYAGLLVTFPAPFKLDLHTFSMSTLGNLSDLTFTTRVDYAYVLLTHLRLEAYAAVMYGSRGGEFRFAAPNVPSDVLERFPPLQQLRASIRPEPVVFMLGLGLRVSI